MERMDMTKVKWFKGKEETEFLVTLNNVFEREDIVRIKIKKQNVIKQLNLSKEEALTWKSHVADYLVEVPELTDSKSFYKRGELVSIEDCGPEIVSVRWGHSN